MAQPDWGEIVDDFFKSQGVPRVYSTHRYRAVLMDLAVFNTLLHDASFKQANITHSDDALEISTQRDCWEFYEELNFPSVRSQLTIVGARQFRWQLGPERKLESDTLLVLNYMWLTEDYRLCGAESFELVFVFSADLRLRVEVSNDGPFEIHLRDLECPKMRT